jgi:hypothetical protein
MIYSLSATAINKSSEKIPCSTRMTEGGEIRASELSDIGINQVEGSEGVVNWNPSREEPKDTTLAGRKPR